MLFTLTLVVLNDLLTAKPPSLINVIAPSINVMAFFINTLNIQPIEAKAITYGKDLATLVKMYTEESKYSKKDDNFNCKLTIFNNLYDKVNIL